MSNNNNNNNEEKLQMVKEFKLTPAKIGHFYLQLAKIQKKPVVEETIDGKEFDVKISSLLEKMIDLSILSLEMNLSVMQNMVAINTEHQLESEIQQTKLKDNMFQSLKALGMDENTFKKYFDS